VSLKLGPLSLVSTIETLLGRNSSSSGLESREYDRGDPLRRPHVTLYPQKLALTADKQRSLGRYSFPRGLRPRSLVFSLVLFICGLKLDICDECNEASGTYLIRTSGFLTVIHPGFLTVIHHCQNSLDFPWSEPNRS
jgi:hypothetical protein